MDVETTFMHGDPQEEVFLKQFLGFDLEHFPCYVYRLDKVVYGLKQDLNSWYDAFSTYVVENNYKIWVIDNTLLIKKTASCLILA